MYFKVMYYKDDSDALPCVDIMNAEQVAAMDDHKIAKIEELKDDQENNHAAR